MHAIRWVDIKSCEKWWRKFLGNNNRFSLVKGYSKQQNMQGLCLDLERIFYPMMMTGSSVVLGFQGIIVELYLELQPVLKHNTSRSPSTAITDRAADYIGIPCNRGIPEEMTDWSGLYELTLNRTMPTVWDWIIHMSTRYIKIPTMQLNRQTSEHNLRRQPAFLMSLQLSTAQTLL